VTARESRVILGKQQEVIVLARVPETLSTDQALSGDTWLKRKRESLSSLNDGDPIGLAHIIRNSARRQAARSPKGGKPPQSLWKRQIATKARSLLSTEIAFARGIEPDEANSWIDQQLSRRP
jgi:RNA polymerase-interacting CarD/CdnL/TRCF family regulator